IWWIPVVMGLIALGVGIFFVVKNDSTLTTVTVILGIFLLIQAAVEILTAILGKGEGRGVLAVVGVVTAIAGLLLVKKPFETLTVLILILGIVFIVAAIARFVDAASSSEGRGGNFLVCLIDLAAGVIILAWPDLTLTAVAVIIGIVLIIRGLLMIAFGLQIKSAEKELASSL
ncbi:MAG: hypothetical protein F2813_08830, partial [Actinobacteria bacterium]|nr:hypothetical protein [Actinomycetota bacterium]